MFPRLALSVLLCTLLFHLISASPTPKLKPDLPNRQPSFEAAPGGWTCNNNWYNTSDGCDCGCGLTDPDCTKDDQSLFCHNSDRSPDTSRCDLGSNTCVEKPPAEWTCTENWYDTNDGCDCGCGATDPDCSKDSQSLFCHNSPLSPSTSTCDEASNRCVPQDWTCPPAWFDTNDGCDCGCGATDPDCSKDGQSLFCHNSPLSPSTSTCDEASNRCVPQDWTCSPAWFDTNDGCDCGCGATDPDCSKDDQTLYCHNSPLSPNGASCNLASNVCEPTGILGSGPGITSQGLNSGPQNPDQPSKVPTKPPKATPNAPRQSPKNPTQATKGSL